MRFAQRPSNVGADVAKDEIVVACAEQTFTPRKIGNNRAALRAWLKMLPADSRIGMEGTGTYHELLAQLAHELGLTVYVLNPKDVRHYAKGVGQRAKTDRVDAQLIARFVAKEHARLHPFVPPTPPLISPRMDALAPVICSVLLPAPISMALPLLAPLMVPALLIVSLSAPVRTAADVVPPPMSVAPALLLIVTVNPLAPPPTAMAESD